MSTGCMLRRAIATLAAGTFLLLNGCGGGGGETRRFDQYPNLLAISGNGVIEAGQQQGLSVVADRDNWRRNNELGRDPSGLLDWGVNRDLSFGVDVASNLVADPRRPMLASDRLEGSSPFLIADFVLTAPAGVNAVTRHSVRAANPRVAVTRDVYVVPAGHLYVRSLSLGEGPQTVLVSGSSTQLTIELSRPAPGGGATVALHAPALVLPATAFVPDGQTTTTVTITGGVIATEAFVLIGAELGGVEQTIGLWLRSGTPFLRGLDFASVLNYGSNSGTVRLSAPAAGRTTVALASNNNLVGVPATVEVADGETFAPFALQVPDQPIPMTAVRITASHNGTVMVADATLGQRVTDPVLESFRVLRIDNTRDDSNLSPGPCIEEPNCDRRVKIQLRLRAAQATDTRVRLFSTRSRALHLDTEFTIPAGVSVFDTIADVVRGPDSTAHRIRFIEIRAQLVSTGQDIGEPGAGSGRMALLRSRLLVYGERAGCTVD